MQLNGSSRARRKPRSRILAAHVPDVIVEAIGVWVEQAPERNASMFVREAVREKLRMCGIQFNEDQTINPKK